MSQVGETEAQRGEGSTPGNISGKWHPKELTEIGLRRPRGLKSVPSGWQHCLARMGRNPTWTVKEAGLQSEHKVPVF